MLFGYARVSTADQNPDHQIDALTRAGVKRQHIYVDTASGAKASRPQLDELLRTLRDGDTLKITRLDRLGRSVPAPRHPRRRGRKGGRRPRLTAEQAALAQELYDSGERTVQQIAEFLGVPRTTIYGHLDRTPKESSEV